MSNITDFLGQEIKVDDFVITFDMRKPKGHSLMIAKVVKINKTTIDIAYKPLYGYMSEYVLGQYGIVKKKDPEKVVVITNKDNIPNDWNKGYGEYCWGNKEEAKEYMKLYPDGYLGNPWKQE